MDEFVTVPFALKELAKYGVTVKAQSLYSRIKLGTVRVKRVGKKNLVDIEHLMSLYNVNTEREKPTTPKTEPIPKTEPTLRPKAVHRVEHTTNEPQAINPLTKDGLKEAFIHMQMKIKEMAIGTYTTESITYRVRLDEQGNEIETPIKKVVTAHLPKLEYIRAFSTLATMINELETQEDTGESNAEVLARYHRYFEALV